MNDHQGPASEAKGEVPITCPSNLQVKGTCFGFEVRSDLDWTYLRSGSGDPLEVTTAGPPEPRSDDLLQEWRPPGAPTHVKLYREADGFHLWIEDGGWFTVDPS